MYCSDLPSSKLPQVYTSYSLRGSAALGQRTHSPWEASASVWPKWSSRSCCINLVQLSSKSSMLWSSPLSWPGLLSKTLLHSSFFLSFHKCQISQVWRLLPSIAIPFSHLSLLPLSFTSDKYLMLLIPSWHPLPKQAKLIHMLTWFMTDTSAVY